MRIYVINLDRDGARRDAMTRQLAAQGLDATRIRALTPDDLDPGDTKTYCDPARGYWLVPTELATSMSHIAAMQAFLRTEDSHAVILEDDVLISLRFAGFLDAFARSDLQIDLLRIETFGDALRLLPDPDRHLPGFEILRPFSWTGGAAGYIISRKAAERISGAPDLRFKQTDRVMFNPYERLVRKLVMRHLAPALCIQSDRAGALSETVWSSAIQTDRAGRAEQERAHFWRRLPHKLADMYETEIRIGSQKLFFQHVLGARKQVIDFAAE